MNEDQYQNFSEDFKKFYFWCISDHPDARFARARNDIPFPEVIGKLSGEELSAAKELMIERLKTEEFFYINYISYFKDKTVIPCIKEHLKIYKERNKLPYTDFSSTIKRCKQIINELKKLP